MARANLALYIGRSVLLTVDAGEETLAMTGKLEAIDAESLTLVEARITPSPGMEPVPLDGRVIVERSRLVLTQVP